MVEHVAVPVRVEAEEGGGDAVVFPHPDGVHAEQTQLLVAPVVSGQETRDVGVVGVHLTVHGLVHVGREEEGVGLRELSCLQQSSLRGQVPEILSVLLRAAVDVRGIHVGRDLVQLLAGSNGVEEDRGCPGCADGTRASEAHALISVDPRVVLGDLDRKAWCFILA